MKKAVILILFIVAGASLPFLAKSDIVTHYAIKSAAKDKIKTLMLSPASASFDLEVHEAKSDENGMRTFEIVGYVDSKNGFGVTVRNVCAAVVKHRRDGLIHNIVVDGYQFGDRGHGSLAKSDSVFQDIAKQLNGNP